MSGHWSEKARNEAEMFGEVNEVAKVRQHRHLVDGQFLSRVSQLHTNPKPPHTTSPHHTLRHTITAHATPYTPCNVLHLVSMLIGCLIGACNLM
jgi:hypothetical protein